MAMGEWSEATDPKTGKTYYYNKITKKTQWTKPVEIAEDLKSSDNDAEDPNEIASNWAEGTDPKSKRVYYYNKITKKTQWSKPDCMGGAGGSGGGDSKPAAKKAVAAAASTDEEEEAPAKPAAKADEWAEAKDPKSGKSYWYNKKTKETTWKNPNADAGSKPAAAAAPAKKEEPAKKVFQKDSDDDDDDDDQEEDGDDDEKDEESEEEEKPVAKKASVAKPAAVASKSSVASKPASAAAAAKKPAAKSKSSDDDDDDDDDHDDDDDRGQESEEEKPVAKKPAATGKKRFDSDEEEEAPAPAKKGGATAKGDVTSIKKTVAQAKADKGEDGEEEEEEEDNETHEFRFAKHRKGWINRTFRIGAIHDDTTLLTYKKSLIKKALLKQNRDLDAEAVQCFKNIMSYMGDRKSSKEPIEHAKKMLRNLMLAPSGLRDEVYMQLCKQTTSNPRVESTIKGWELMSFCLATFPPSKHLKNFLGDFIKKHAEDKSNSRIQDLAQQCQERLPIIVQMGQRKQVPSTLELQCLMDNKPVPIRVNLANGTFKSFTVDPYTLNKDVEEMLQQKYNLTVTSPFALYEAAEANVERILEPKDRILDVAASWENKPLVDEVKLEKTKEKVKSYEKANKNIKEVVRKEIKYNSFLYKAKLVLKTTNQEVMSDPEAINLIYIQATSDVVTQRYPSNEKDITVLAALQLQATFGDYKKDTHVPGWLKPKIDEFMPKNLLQKKGTRSDQSISEWETKILAKYQKVSGFTSLEAKLNYLDYVQEWVFYGATFFLVEQRQFKDYPSPLTLGINCEGVLLMHPEKQTVLENYAYTDIVTWGHSDEKFIVVVGNIVQQRKLIFKTVEGKQMNHLIHDYVKFKVKNKEVVPPSD